jgi:hypothetical protein
VLDAADELVEELATLDELLELLDATLEALELDFELELELGALLEATLDELDAIDELLLAVAGLYEHHEELLGAPGKLVSAQAKVPVKVAWANTPDLPMAARCVPLTEQSRPASQQGSIVNHQRASEIAKRTIYIAAAKTTASIFIALLQTQTCHAFHHVAQELTVLTSLGSFLAEVLLTDLSPSRR